MEKKKLAFLLIRDPFKSKISVWAGISVKRAGLTAVKTYLLILLNFKDQRFGLLFLKFGLNFIKCI